MYRNLAGNQWYTVVWHFENYDIRSTSYFCQKEVYRDSIGIPLLVLLCLQYALSSWFSVKCTVKWQKEWVYRCLAF